MINEKIYVVVPVYKVEAYLERCVESILNQTYDNYELILVDDGSPDNCPAICDRYAEQYDHITVIHQENGGLSAARNAGIEYALAKGNPEQDWINFIDSDDFVHPKYLEYLYRAAKEAGTELSSCGFVKTSSAEIHSADIGELKYESLTSDEYGGKNSVNVNIACAKLYRLFLFKEIRYPLGKLYEDTFTTYLLLFQRNKIANIETRLYYYYNNPNSITGSVWTPKYLDLLEAMETQIRFYKSNGYKKALKVSSEEYYKFSLRALSCIKELSPKYDHMMETFKVKHKQALHICIRDAGLGKMIICWIKTWTLSQKKLRRLVKRYYITKKYGFK